MYNFWRRFGKLDTTPPVVFNMNYQNMVGIRNLAGDIYRTLLGQLVSEKVTMSIGHGLVPSYEAESVYANLRAFAIKEAKMLVCEVESAYLAVATEDDVVTTEFGFESDALPIIDSEFGSMPGGA